ncbi:Bipolar DNA helicase [Rhodovulum sp. PH10]|uniref:ATP-binding protein n=1 Tax=Rhodovulum sp. PH10 TaxID=1187851 RepID=UPI00027C1F9F|nr:ATP-binding protein [Rhodovulum sp. PH10]EJW13261.1 Bipolar DNA helicase [Rhodovulum sp. PH10]
MQDADAEGRQDELGFVLTVKGSQAVVGLRDHDTVDIRATVARFMAIASGHSTLIGVVTEVSLQLDAGARAQGFFAVAQLDLMGEIVRRSDGEPVFRRGIEEYPTIGDPVSLISREVLRIVYDISGDTIHVGDLHQDDTIGAHVDIDDMLSKHFAVLGTTGVGKSSGVALILQETLAKRPDLRIFLLDVHNEYGRCFGERAQLLAPRNLKLPFWLFNFEEIVDVFFGGRPGVEEETEILAEVIPIAKVAYLQYRTAGPERPALRRPDPRSAGFTADTPVPYRLADLIGLIDERMGKLENRASRMVYHKLIGRIESVANDPRYAFMFENANVGGDTMAEVISTLFRLPPAGRPMTIMQLAGFPAEVVDSLVSVLCRLAFDFGLWSDGAVPLLFVCEEAHRYASADRSIGFGPTRKALSRIAKEGRKYGVYLGLVTQRPAELDPTIISQCSTLFAMRMANDRDQALLRSAVSDAAANLLAFVPSLGTREVLAFGEGVALPTRLRFKELPAHLVPRSEAVVDSRVVVPGSHDQSFVAAVVERWRGAIAGGAVRTDEPAVPDEPAATGHGLDPDRFKILKKPLGPSPGAAPGHPPGHAPVRATGWPPR